MLIDRFISRARRSRFELFVKLAATITKHSDGIRAADHAQLRTGRAEPLTHLHPYS
jgi:hypothetical protein